MNEKLKDWKAQLTILIVTAMLSGGGGAFGGSAWMQSELSKKATTTQVERLLNELNDKVNKDHFEKMEGLIISLAVDVCNLREGASQAECDRIRYDYYRH